VTPAAQADREIVITRVLDAPRDAVWAAWTDPAQVPRWFGPQGFTTTVHEMDVRPGGAWRFTMHGPDGVDYENDAVYEEVAEPERLRYRYGPDEEGHPGFVSTITFEDQDGKTRITLRTVFESAAERDRQVEEVRAIEGGNQTLDRLEAHLAG
jgi:uncharacterized protein YndB with AHSA1/START domain